MANDRRYLLDTQVFILWMKSDKGFKADLSTILKDPENTVYLSLVSIWEMIIIKRIGKLKLPNDWKETLARSRFSILYINLDHLYTLDSLPLHHSDPFDRLLVAQAISEKATIITADKKIWRYDLPLIKA